MPARLARLRTQLVEPFLAPGSSVRQVAWGAAVGMLTALLPLFGVQLYVAMGLWALCRRVAGASFNLPVCFAVSWVMNPLTVVPLYYLYYRTGDAAWEAVTMPTPDWTYPEFEALLLAAIAPETGPWWERLLGGAVVLIEFFGGPIVLGSVLWAVPLSAATFWATRWGLARYRARRGAAAGLAARLDSP